MSYWDEHTTGLNMQYMKVEYSHPLKTFLLLCKIWSWFFLNSGWFSLKFVKSLWQRSPTFFESLIQQSLLTIWFPKNTAAKISLPQLWSNLLAQLLKYFSYDVDNCFDSSWYEDPVLNKRAEPIINVNIRQKLWNVAMVWCSLILIVGN